MSKGISSAWKVFVLIAYDNYFEQKSEISVSAVNIIGSPWFTLINNHTSIYLIGTKITISHSSS